MADWTLSGALGDLAGPLLLAAVAALGCSFRGAWVLAGVVFIAWGSFAARGTQHGPRGEGSGSASEPGSSPAGTSVTLRRSGSSPGSSSWPPATARPSAAPASFGSRKADAAARGDGIRPKQFPRNRPVGR